MHPLFKDAEAAVPFKTVAELEEHVNILATMPWQDITKPQVTFERKLHLVYGDFRPRNFMFDENGRDMWIVGFQHVSFLPLSFQTFALHAPFLAADETAWQVKEHLTFALPEENMKVMIHAHAWFVRSSGGMGVFGRGGEWFVILVCRALTC